jgi:site-specific recombinase XerD
MFLIKEKHSPYYQLVYNNDEGKRKKKSTKRKLKSEALIFLSEFRENLEKKKEIKIVFIQDFEIEYLAYIKSMRAASYHRSIKYSLDCLIGYTGNLKLNQLDYRLMEKFILKQSDSSKSCAALYYRTLKSAFEKALSWGYLKENPFKKFKSPKVPKTFPVFIDYKMLNIILEKEKSSLMKDIYLTAFLTGMRLGELVNLKWNSIDLNTQTIKVECSETFTTKNKKERIIPINKTLFELLRKRMPKIIDINLSGYVFCKIRGVKLNEDFVSKSFKQASKDAGMNEGVHFHTLRHSFASSLIQKGVSLYVIKELLGHSDIAVTQIYSHLKQDNLTDAVRLLDLADPAEVKTSKNKKA